MSIVRLAYNPGPINSYKALAPPVRLSTSAQDDSDRPAILVSYVYLKPFLKYKPTYYYRDWVMDSGAFSAANSGVTIDLQAYIDCCKEMFATDPTLTEVFALDVIEDWRASIKNTEKMWAQGVPAIPTYHAGEPWEVLDAIARDYPKIALGGAVGMKKVAKNVWAGKCFKRVWPKKIHGLGFGSEDSILMVPWHSVDATSWEIGPCRFGRWATYGQMSVRGAAQNLQSEIRFYMAIEDKARARWRREMAKLEAIECVKRLPSN